MDCTDKFGREVSIPKENAPYDFAKASSPVELKSSSRELLAKTVAVFNEDELFSFLITAIRGWNYEEIRSNLKYLEELADSIDNKGKIIGVLTRLIDRHYQIGTKRRRSILQVITESIHHIFRAVPFIREKVGVPYLRIDLERRSKLRGPQEGEKILVADASGFEPEGENSFSRLISDAYGLGWKSFICFGQRGQRFLGCTFGPETRGVRIDSYDSSGDYLASGIDGLEIHVHGNAQDQLGQILKSGKLVVYGDVGQTFMYGAKGGEVYVMGNAAGRPLINAAGKPRVIINGTALDFLAESFMAGNPYDGGGFVILNGITFNESGSILGLETPYPGSNIFSLASGGAIYVRDPYSSLDNEQLNGGYFRTFAKVDWDLIKPYLEENEKLFGISIDDLLTVDGVRRTPAEVYRVIAPIGSKALAEAEQEAFEMNEEWQED
jgi:hypothetical protein